MLQSEERHGFHVFRGFVNRAAAQQVRPTNGVQFNRLTPSLHHSCTICVDAGCVLVSPICKRLTNADRFDLSVTRWRVGAYNVRL